MTHPNKRKETPNIFVILANIAVTIPSQLYARRAHNGLVGRKKNLEGRNINEINSGMSQTKFRHFKELHQLPMRIITMYLDFADPGRAFIQQERKDRLNDVYVSFFDCVFTGTDTRKKTSCTKSSTNAQLSTRQTSAMISFAFYKSNKETQETIS
jgi:hypothetical protein